jgi:hypothetical protein
MSDSVFDRIVAEAASALQAMADAIADPATYETLLQSLGVTGNDPAAGGILAALASLADLNNEIATMANETSPSFADIAHVLKSARDAFAAIEAIDSGSGPASSLGGVGKDLIKALIIGRLGFEYPLLYDLLVLLTVVEPPENAAPTATVVDGGAFRRMPVFLPEFHFERLSPLLSNPEDVLRAAYLTPLALAADADAMADRLFPRLANVLADLGIPHVYGVNDSERALLGDGAVLVDHALLVYLQSMAEGAAVDGGVTLALSAADRGDLGLVVTPFGGISYTVQSGNWTIAASLTANVAAFAYGKHGVTILASAGTVEIDGSFTATLAAPDGGPAFVFGSSTGSRLELGGAKLSFDLTLSEAAQAFGLDAEVSKSSIVISGGDGDGFVSSLIPKDGLRTDFDFGIAWSNSAGLSFHGAAGLDATIPLNVSLAGTFLVPSAHIALQASDKDLSLEISASVGLALGPLQVLVDRLGVLALFDFSSGSGSAGVGDFSVAFKPPSGAGIAIDAAGVNGGGFLGYEPEKSEYQGYLQLQFSSIALQAFGLITTQVAGADGYSLIALVDADFPPVELGLGFTLNGVGGLLALHRTAAVDALRAAVKAGRLGTILFPKNAIANAPQVLGELDALFPTAPGRFLFGPMALIGWGTPTVLTASLGVIIELPEPVEIILLGVIQAKFPTPEAPLVRLNMDVLGVLDLSQDELSLDATLFDSKLVTFTISGDMALRASWGSKSEFLLAIGGFHPQFTPPPGFPALKRITIDMPSGIVTKMRLAAYLAVTSNTLQFGAQLDVFIGVSGYGLSGHLGFDALLQLSPFRFAADISGSIALMAGNDDLMSVSLDATLTGPAPWNVSGKFKIHIVFFDVHLSFSQSWGLDAPSPPTPAVDVGALLSTALADPRNWNSQLPAGLSALVSTRQVEDPAAVFAHPLAQLGVHERVVPLGLAITRFGEAALAGADEFTITDFRVGAGAPRYTTVQDNFPPAQFFDLSDTEKLARPSFELHDAGVVTSDGLVTSGSPLTKTIDYETSFIDTPGVIRVDEGVSQPFPWGVIGIVVLTGSAARKSISLAGHRRYAAPGNPVTVAEPAFAVVDTTTLTPQGSAPAGKTTYSDMNAILADALAAAPGKRGSLQIIATHEMAAT